MVGVEAPAEDEDVLVWSERPHPDASTDRAARVESETAEMRGMASSWMRRRWRSELRATPRYGQAGGHTRRAGRKSRIVLGWKDLARSRKRGSRPLVSGRT